MGYEWKCNTNQLTVFHVSRVNSSLVTSKSRVNKKQISDHNKLGCGGRIIDQGTEYVCTRFLSHLRSRVYDILNAHEKLIASGLKAWRERQKTQSHLYPPFALGLASPLALIGQVSIPCEKGIVRSRSCWSVPTPYYCCSLRGIVLP